MNIEGRGDYVGRVALREPLMNDQGELFLGNRFSADCELDKAEAEREDLEAFMLRLSGGKPRLTLGDHRRVCREKNRRINDWLLARGFNPLPTYNADIGRSPGPSEEVIAARKVKARERLEQFLNEHKGE